LTDEALKQQKQECRDRYKACSESDCDSNLPISAARSHLCSYDIYQNLHCPIPISGAEELVGNPYNPIAGEEPTVQKSELQWTEIKLRRPIEERGKRYPNDFVLPLL